MTAAKKRVLVVDDDPGVVDYLVEMLEQEGYSARGEVHAQEALKRVGQQRFDLVISDVQMPGMYGLDLLHAIQAQRPEQLVMLITAFGTVDLAVQAVKQGACDFVTKPFKMEVLLHAMEGVFRERQMRREIVRLRSSVEGQAVSGLLARSPAMQKVVHLASRVAGTQTLVLLTGESGTGKGAVARYIHDHSAVRDGPFVGLNCGALPATLVESELFGARKGAFTDARQDREGLFAQAHNGTLFLDEVGELPLESQPKLLHVLESGRVRPMGATRDVPVNVRLIAATNRPLEEAVAARQFRQDLYHRLNVVRVDIPPLRERREDIEPLADLFLQRANEKLGRDVMGISSEGLRWMMRHPWSGNVRELANTMERAVAVTDHDTLLLEDLQPSISLPPSSDFLGEAVEKGTTLADVESAYIARALHAANGNKSRAARMLGIDRRTLHRKLHGDAPDDSEE
jgi:DNA-binding NtrC family response regulator